MPQKHSSEFPPEDPLEDPPGDAPEVPPEDPPENPRVPGGGPRVPPTVLPSRIRLTSHHLGLGEWVVRSGGVNPDPRKINFGLSEDLKPAAVRKKRR